MGVVTMAPTSWGQQPAVRSELGRFCGARNVVACANGTDAIALPLMAMELKAGQAVICPSFTFAATAEAVCLCGGTPIFVDVDPSTYTLDPRSLALRWTRPGTWGLRSRR